MEQDKNELVRVALEPLSVADAKANIQAIQKILDGVMIPGTHYGVITGCGKKTVLLKPGAEKILSTFQIGTEPKTEDLSDGYEFRYRITVKGFHIPTGNVIGYGVGECSTIEKKYAWRAAVCDEEYEDTPENRRQIHYKSWNGKTEKVKQVRQNPADIANTVLKMAKKRAMIDLCLTATACSDIFEQDLDETHIAEANGVEAGPRPPQQQAPQGQGAAILCGVCQSQNINQPKKRSENSPDYRCNDCGAVAWNNNGQLTWKPGKK